MITPVVCGARKLEDVFAYKFALLCVKQRPLYLKKGVTTSQDSLQHLNREFKNCAFSEEEWRVTSVNKDFK
jgi:hypothetical protein